jgi:hypothetical protein
LKKEAANLASKVNDITFDWSRDTVTGDEYELLAEILGKVEYNHLTNLVWILETKTASYNPAITATTATHQRKRAEEEWERKRASWFIRKGFPHGVVMNMHDALDEQYYSQLKQVNTAYRNITPIQILTHLNTRWCPLNVHGKKVLKKEFYTNWDPDTHLTAFGMKLNKEQNRLNRLGIIISNEDKLQFYMEQIYESNQFDKNEMMIWENKDKLTKNNYAKVKLYFERLINNAETYAQNSGRTAGKKGYESANQMANVGDMIRKYIQEIASATMADKEKSTKWAASMNESAKKKDTKIKVMTMQIKNTHRGSSSTIKGNRNQREHQP